MYTMRVKSIAGDTNPNFNEFVMNFDHALRHGLSEFGYEILGVHPFLGRVDHYTIHGFKKKGGNSLEHRDWIRVNQVINTILDDMKVVAFVCATESTSTYTVRSSREVGEKLKY